MIYNVFASELESRVAAALNDIPSRCSSKSDVDWTNAVKSSVAGAIHGQGLAIHTNCAQIQDAKQKEWIYDLCAIEKNEKGHLLSVKLVLESEWSNNRKERQWDFQKLLIARAELRVFVTQARTAAAATAALEQCQAEVVQSSVSLRGDRFIVCIWENLKNQMHIHVVEKE